MQKITEMWNIDIEVILTTKKKRFEWQIFYHFEG